ncbi:acyltransferase [Vibrio metschnikovii]|uniref:acyltransferase n=1 Tax=Vibrio metschnikovii TaxID=28172 RepID=UPI00059422DC|nr:acyltransferase [Vibrio metschnikovii]
MISVERLFRLKSFVIIELCQFFRRLIYMVLFNSQRVISFGQPVLMRGKGKVTIGKNVTFGVGQSPNYLNTVGYIDCREEGSSIIISDNVKFNNNFSLISRVERIFIGENCLIGGSFKVFSSDFHSLNFEDRSKGHAMGADVTIGNNVFIADNVTILKGVEIGDNSVIGAGSIVTKSIPKKCVYAGNPAVFIKRL